MKVIVAISTLLCAANANVVLYHRIFHPMFPNLKYLKRGVVSGQPPHLYSSDSLIDDIKTLSEPLSELGDSSGILYQIALALEENKTPDKLDFSSVKACHLDQATAETIVLHVNDKETPFALDYFVSPIPNNGSCPEDKSRPISLSTTLQKFADNIQQLNTTILVKRPKTPPVPFFLAPPTLTPEGDVVQPPPPKSFFQKYWMYIGAFLLVILMITPEESEQPRNNGQGQN